MEPFQTIAALHSMTSLHGVAYSALPDAPVQPYAEPRRRIRRVLASIHRPARPPVIDLRPARFSTEC
jgi:hypothetical protein